MIFMRQKSCLVNLVADNPVPAMAHISSSCVLPYLFQIAVIR